MDPSQVRKLIIADQTRSPLKGHVVPPCVVLVIDDNLYGLTVAVSYIWRICWSPCVGFKEFMRWPKCFSRNYPKIGHVWVELIASMSWRRRLCDHSCLPSRHHLNEESWKDSMLIKTKSRVNQVDQLTKRRRSTERDQVIPWYGKHYPLRFVY